MIKISFKPRSGKDLFNFLERSGIDTKLAINWAIEEYVQIDGKSLNIDQISKLNDQAYLMISSKIFPMKDPRIIEDNEGIHYENILIKNKRISRDFITELQTDVQKFNNNSVGLMKHCISIFFDITISELEIMPFQIAAFLINKINFFLEELTTPRDEFLLDSVWIDDSRKSSDRELDNLV